MVVFLVCIRCSNENILRLSSAAKHLAQMTESESDAHLFIIMEDVEDFIAHQTLCILLWEGAAAALCMEVGSNEIYDDVFSSKASLDDDKWGALAGTCNEAVAA